ncbi:MULTISPECIES: RagB/SusD family nutrient uptake outer membrane protein [unclassified Saccharicrinis]|uniref:RagB/SusD family nutrient uptake outer membrane protein n=1 Tax=unclassified Saccharicrinis TaxID=2646859 RepID=UPI003D32B495
MKRKNIFHINLGIILFLLLLNSCEEVLEVTPSDKVSIDRLLNKEDPLRDFRDNCYLKLNKSFTVHSDGAPLEVYSDDAFMAGTGSTFDWHNAQLSTTKTFMGVKIWNDCWEGIRKCNLAITYIPKSTVPKDKLDDETLNMWVAEAKLLRAWYHFELIKNFGAVPFVDKPLEPGFAGWADLKRPSFEEIASRIAQECDEVIEDDHLPLRYQVAGEYGLVNKAVAYALKSRVLLYNASTLNNPNEDAEKWQRAATAAQECLSAIGNDYGLLSMSDYGLLFSDSYTTQNNEIILASNTNSAATLNENNGVDLKALGTVKQSSNCGAVPTQELVDCFELTDGTLPISAYNTAEHTDVTFAEGYNETTGADIYANRDMRLSAAIAYNGINYGRYPGQPAASSDLVIYTYEGKDGTGYNPSFTSQDELDKRRSTTGYYSKKFRSASYWGSTPGGTNSFKIYFRLAEIYLNLAEAQCEAGNLDAAKIALNMVRQRAGQPAIADVPGFQNTKAFIIKRIRNERRVEFCFEGHRFYDQRRWKVLAQTNEVISGMKITSTGGDNGPFSYERVKIDVPRNATSDRYLVLPIHFEEARRLTGMGQPDAWN